MSMFPCKKCGAMIGVVGQCVYKCTCPPPTAEEIAAMRAEQAKIFTDAQNGIGQIVTIPGQITQAQKLQMSNACVEHVKAAMSALPNVVDVDVNVEISVSVRVSVPVGQRGELDDIFNTEGTLMEKFPMVNFDFNVALDYNGGSSGSIIPAPESEAPPETNLDVQA